MTEVTTFRKVFVENLLDMDDNRVSGYVYLTEGQEKPKGDDWLDHYLHIVKNDYKHKHYGNKDYMLFVDRSEYSSNDISELEKYLFDWAEGEYHKGEYIIIEPTQERSIHNQFPEFDDKEGFTKLLLGLANYDFVDECWHNEAMPHVCKMMPTTKYPDRAMRIWIDWKDKNKSELYHDATKDEVFYRFNVHLCGEYGDHDTTEFQKDFETLEEVLEFVKDFFESTSEDLTQAKGLQWIVLHDQWNEWLNKQDNIDDKEADAQGVITCYTLTEDQKEFVTDFIERWEQ